MAQPSALRSTAPLEMPQGDLSSVDPQDTTYFSGCKGLNFTQPSGTLDPTWLTDCANFRFDYGFLVTRHGFVLKGGITAAAPTEIMKVLDFTYSTTDSVLLRFCLDRVQFWDGTYWSDAGGTYTLTGTNTDQFTFTAFNNLLIFSNGVDGLFYYDPTRNSVIKITGGPACKHLTTFNGRVVASNIVAVNPLPYRIQWSVKDDYSDWTGLGSGFEDLLSTPGGSIDEQIGVYPITDYAALAVRSNSIWQMTETGDLDAPFRFERLYAGLGSKWRDSIVAVPGGIVGFFNDDIYLVSEQALQKIGTPIGRALRYRQSTSVQVYALYGPTMKTYSFVEYDPALPYSPYAPYIYQYSFIDNGWTRDTHPAPNPKSLSVTLGSTRALSIATSPGLIVDAGTDSIISEVDPIGDSELNSLVVADASHVWYEDSESWVDQLNDGTLFTPEKRLTSGLLSPASRMNYPQVRINYRLHKTHVNGFQIAYESDTDINNCFVEIVDGDLVNVETVTAIVPLTGSQPDENVQNLGVRIVTGPLKAVGHNKKLQLRITDNTNYFKLVALILGLMDGAEAGFGSFQ